MKYVCVGMRLTVERALVLVLAHGSMLLLPRHYIPVLANPPHGRMNVRRCSCPALRRAALGFHPIAHDGCHGLEHFQEKWKPVFRPKMRSMQKS
jgi:hypothetical protein